MGKDKALGEGSLTTKMVEVEEQEGDGVRRRSRRVRNLPPECDDVEEDRPGGSGSKRARFEEGEAGITKPEVTKAKETPMMTRRRQQQRCANPKKEGEEDAGLGIGSLEETGTVELLLEPGEASTSTSSSTGGDLVISSGSSSSGPGLQGEELDEAHPCLFNEDVLENIFKFILGQPRDVQNIRQVCHTWMDSMTRLYRRTRASAMFLDWGEDFPRENNLSQFVEAMRGSNLIPVQKFTLVGDAFFQPGSRTVVHDFFRICGPEIVSLRIDLMRGYSDSHRQVLHYSLLTIPEFNLIKLKKLEFAVFVTGRSKGGAEETVQAPGTVSLLEGLLTGAKALQELEVVCVPIHFQSEPLVNLRALEMERVGRAIFGRIAKTVKNLKLRMNLTPPLLNDLAEQGLKLEVLNLTFVSFSPTGALRTFLGSQAATLKDLKICLDDRRQETVTLELPPLDELVKLELKDAIRVQFPFAKSFPKLGCLRVLEMRDGYFSELLSNPKSYSPSLRELHLPHQRWSFNSPLIRKVAERFPNLKELHISRELGAHDGVGEVFTHLAGIESLHISFNDLDNVDAMLTGIPHPDCVRMSNRRSLLNANLADLQREPSILNLTKLKTLVLRTVEHPWHGILLTNVSAHIVFLQLASLRELRLIGFESQMSRGYIRRLQDKLHLKLWRTGDDYE